MSFVAAAVQALAPTVTDFLKQKGGEVAGGLITEVAAKMGASDAIQQGLTNIASSAVSSFADNLSQNIQQAPPQSLGHLSSAVMNAGMSTIAAEQGAIQNALYQQAVNRTGQFLQTVS